MNKENKKPRPELDNIKKTSDSSPKEDENKLITVKKKHDEANRYKITEDPADEQMLEDQ